jgi:hypothetical protein
MAAKHLFFACAVGALASGAAFAHHSQAPYDMTRDVFIEGTVAEVAWKNPHVYMTLEVAGADGASQLQDVELVSVPALRSLGLTPEAIPVGAAVVVRAHPNRGGPGRSVFGLDVTASDGSIYPLSTQGRNSHTPDATEPADGLAGRWAPLHDPQLVPTASSWPVKPEARPTGPESVASSPASECRFPPPPMLSMFPELRTIEVGGHEVRMTFETNGMQAVRSVRLDLAEHPADLEPSILGHAIGRWEGETLVIDTIGFQPHPMGLGFGGISSPSKHLVERLTLADDRLHLRYEMTLEDPENLSAPATYETLWAHRPDLEPAEACDPETAVRYLEEKP